MNFIKRLFTFKWGWESTTPVDVYLSNSVDLVDFGEIERFIQNHFPNIADDPRLTQDPECIREVPFKRILTRGGKTGLYSLIIAAIRVYASTHLFKAMGTFSKIMPKFPDNFSSIYAAYIVERMEEDFRNAPDGFWGWAQSFKDDEFWYGFLEQSVECYDFLVDAGEIQENRPSDWGGFQVKISYFEFWEAFEDRLNYRECYKKESDSWRKFFLQS
mgnify:CR=1 FL=1